MTHRLRIALYAPHFAEYVCRLALGLASQADVLLFVDRRNLAQECEPALVRRVAEAVRLVPFGSVGKRERMLALGRMVWETQRFRPDIVHIQEQPDKLTAWVARYAARFHRVMLTVHDPKPHTGSDSLYALQTTAWRNTIRSLAHGFHVHGDHCERELKTTIDARRPVLSTNHGVLLVPEPAERRPPEAGRVLMFGRMEAYKGVEVLLDAAEILHGRQVPFRLVLAGRGPEIQRLRARLAGAPFLELVEGFIDPEAARAQIARAALVAAPYLDATQSGVVSAAYGGGRPVVASHAGGLADAVHDGVNGLLVPPGAPAALADALERCLRDDDLRRRLQSGAEETARGPFDWGHIAAQMLAFQRTRLIDGA